MVPQPTASRHLLATSLAVWAALAAATIFSASTPPSARADPAPPAAAPRDSPPFEGDEDQPSPLTPVIGVDPDRLWFGDCILAGTCTDRTIDLFNAAADPTSILEVASVSVLGPSFSLAGGPPPPLSIPGDGTRVTYTVRFCAADSSTPGDLLIIAYNAANPIRDVQLAGITNTPPFCDAGGPYAGSVGNPVLFDGRISRDREGPITSYDWDFGDGTTATGGNPTHVYSATGTYVVTLAVADTCDVVSTCQTTADITLFPNQAPICDAGGPYYAVLGDLVQFDGTASYDPDGTIAAYAWAFGDGSSGVGPTPTHRYTTPGDFPVTLCVTDDDAVTRCCPTFASIHIGNIPPFCDAGGPYAGAAGEPVAFDGSGSYDPDGVIVTYRWTFGDGGLGDGPTPTHTYLEPRLFTVDLFLTDDRGAVSSCTTTAQISVPNQVPVCDAGGPYLGVVGASIHFDGSRSSDPDGAIVAYAWEFGDGATGSGSRPSHVYGGIASYTVGLCVTDDGGDMSCCTTTADIRDAGTPLTPVIGVEPETLDFGSCLPPGLCTDLPIEVFNAVGDPGSILHVTGIQVAGAQFALAGGPAPPIAIPGDGTRAAYTVRFCPTGDPGAGAFTVTAPGAANSPRDVALRGTGNLVPVCDAGGPYTGIVGQPIHFDGSGSHDPGGAIAAYAWSFGDGATGGGPTPLHIYAAPGTHNVGLAVTDACGARATCETTARTGQPPVCNPGGPYSGRPFETITFDGTGSHDPDGIIVAYTWSFGDGTTGTGPAPTHAYGAINFYTVTLCVDDNDSLRSCCQTYADIYDLSPVELAAFTAAASGGAVELRWRTSREIDHAGFEVERTSENGGDFAVVSGERPVTDGDRDGAYAFDDHAVEGGATYLYRIAAIGLDGSRRSYGPLRVEVPRALPTALVFHLARPNPFNPSNSITFAFELPAAGPVSVRIYDPAGRLVRTLADRAPLAAGTHALAWDGRSERGPVLPSGIFVVRLEAGGQVRAEKLVLTR